MQKQFHYILIINEINPFSGGPEDVPNRRDTVRSAAKVQRYPEAATR